MKLWLLALLAAALFGMRLRRPPLLVWIAAWLLSFYLFLKLGFAVPIPGSVLKMYMGIALLATLAYVTSSAEYRESFFGPLQRLMVEPRYTPILALVVVGLPILVAGSIYHQMSQPLEAPSFARTIHPAPPDSVTAFGSAHAISTIDNPVRALEHDQPEAFAARMENGRKVYYQNCFYCHGDSMRGDGMYAYGLDPIPTNFADPGTIAMLREAFLFWRVAKGGPGLPDEGGPWATAMPAWEKFLTEDEVWDVVAYLYEYTDQKPRAVEEHH